MPAQGSQPAKLGVGWGAPLSLAWAALPLPPAPEHKSWPAGREGLRVWRCGAAFGLAWADPCGRLGDRVPWVGVSLALVHQQPLQACFLLRKVGSLLQPPHRWGGACAPSWLLLSQCESVPGVCAGASVSEA